MLGHRSTTTTFKMGQKRLAGAFLANVGKRFIPLPLSPRVRVLGVVEAGWPSPAEEELLDTMSFDEYLAPDKSASYILRVKGESMIDAGIQSGDMVLVERTTNPRDGDIVIAEIDGEWTMKFFRRQGKRVWLEAANQGYQAITPERELTVVAVVRAVVRKYA